MGDDVLGPADPTRRRLLIGGAALAAGLAVGCSSDDTSSPTTTTASEGPPDTRPPPDLASTPFTLGVASGDPRPDSVVLWTRLAPDPLAADGLGGMPDQPVDVAWVVRAHGTSNVLSEGVATAEPAHGHAVHVTVDDLSAATAYDYAFTVGPHTSATGTFSTLPDGSPGRFALAVVNCQWFETGTYAAYEKPTPLIGPSWFDCFDAGTLTEDLEGGAAAAFLGQRNIKPGVDRVVAVYPDGRGFAWNQLNGSIGDDQTIP